MNRERVRNRIRRACLWLLFLPLFLACASVRHAGDLDRVNDIRRGETTRVDTLAWFGPPVRRESFSSGDVRNRHVYHEWSNVLGISSTGTLVIDFDQRGVVLDYTMFEDGEVEMASEREGSQE